MNWISVKEKLPPEGKYVLITDTTCVGIGWLGKDGEWLGCCSDYTSGFFDHFESLIMKVTHSSLECIELPV